MPSGGRSPGGRSRCETERMEDKPPSGGKTLIMILLAMLAILAVLVGLAVWASRG